MFHISSLGYLCFYTIRTLSRTVPRDPLTQTTPPILIGRLHSYDFRSNCIVNHDLTLSSRLHVIQHFETICTNWYYHKSTRFRQPNNGKSKYIPTAKPSSFAFAVKYLVLPWGILFFPWGFWFCRAWCFCFCREVFGFVVTVMCTINRPFAASHSRGTKQPRWRTEVALWQDICLFFVLSQCDFCSPTRRFCTTWMSSCKGPIHRMQIWRVCTGGYGWQTSDVTDMRRWAKLRTTLLSRRGSCSSSRKYLVILFICSQLQRFLPDKMFRSKGILLVTTILCFLGVISATCPRSNYSALNDALQSPGDISGKYPANHSCTYDVRVPAGKRIILAFKSFKILGSMPHCPQDSLEIIVG